MDLKNEEKTVDARDDFMFYETYKDTIDGIRKRDPVAAGKLCMAVIRLGVRQEWTDDLPPEQKAFLKSIAPLIKRSQEKKEETIEAKNRARKWYAKQKKCDDSPGSPPPSSRQKEQP